MRASSRFFALHGAVILTLAAASVGLAQQRGSPSTHAPEPLLRSVQELLQRGDAVAARSQLAQALKQYPKEPVLHNFLGVLEAQQNRYTHAEESFRKAVTLAPAYAGAWENLARLYHQNLDKDQDAARKAIAAYEALLSLNPASAEANYQVAVLLLAQGEFARARHHIDRLPAEAGARAQALVVRCAAEAGLGDMAGVEAAAAQLVNSPDLTEADITSILPVLGRSNQDGIAIRLLEGLASRRLASSDTLRSLASLYERQEQLPEARKTFESAAAAGQVSAPLLLDLARVAYKQKDFEGALSYLAHARDLEPNNAGIHFFWGLVSVELELPVEAERALLKAVELNPENPYYSYALGAVIAGSKKWSDAIPYLKKYCEKKPDDPRGKLALASAHYHTYEYDLARKELREIVDKPETAAGAHYHLGLLAIQENNFEEAVRELEEAVRLSPKYADAHAELGFTYMQMEQFDKARTALDRSLELKPDDRRANMVLLSLYQRTEDPRAEAQMKKFEELDKKLTERTKLLLRTIEARPY